MNQAVDAVLETAVSCEVTHSSMQSFKMSGELIARSEVQLNVVEK
jgi:hypothetical protein